MLKALQKSSARDFKNLESPLNSDDDGSSEEEDDDKKNMMSTLGLIAKEKNKKGKKNKGKDEGGDGPAGKEDKDEKQIAALTIKQDDTKERVVSKLSKLHSLMVKKMSTEKDSKVKKTMFDKSKEISKSLLDPGSFKTAQQLMLSAASLLKGKPGK